MSDDQEQVPRDNELSRLRSALAGRDLSLSANVAVRAIEQMPRHEALSTLRQALEQSARGTVARLAVLGALGRIGGDDAGAAITANFAALTDAEAVRAARSLALTAGTETLDRLTQLHRRDAPRVQAALVAARRLIAFRTGADVDLPAEAFTPNPPSEDVRTILLRVQDAGADATPPEPVASALPSLIPAVTLRAEAIRRVDCAGATMWLATNAALADATAARQLLLGRSIVAVLAQYDGCSEVTYARYLVGYDRQATEMILMTPDGRVTHSGLGELEGNRFRFTLSAGPISRAFSGQGSFDLETGALDLSGTIAIHGGSRRDDPSAIIPVNSLGD